MKKDKPIKSLINFEWTINLKFLHDGVKVGSKAKGE